MLRSLGDCLYALQATIPHLIRSSQHRFLQRHGISKARKIDGEVSATRIFESYSIGHFYIYLAKALTVEGKLYMFVVIDRTSKFAFVELHERATTRIADDFLFAPSHRFAH